MQKANAEYERRQSVGVTMVPVTIFANVIVSRSDDRTALIIGCPAGNNNVVVSPRQFINTTDGIKIPINGPPLVLSRSLHGALVTSEWYARASGNDVIPVLESLGG